MKPRPYRDRDIPELVSLLNRSERTSYEFIPYTRESLGRELKRASRALIAANRDDHVVGLAYLHQEWYGEAVSLFALPGGEQEDIYNLLLPAIEGQTQTGVVSISIDTSLPERVSFFRARGYGNEARFYQLVAPLDRLLRLPQAPKGYLIRSLRVDEEKAFISLVNTAYDDERLDLGTLATWKAEEPDFNVDWVQIAEFRGELVAAVAAHTDRAFNEHYHACRAYLGPAATLPVHRGKGLTKGLTARAMQFLSDRGMQTARLHTWEGNPPALAVATHLGFHLDHEWKILHKTLH